VATVAAAFASGAYDGTTYSGAYGDIGAAVAAIMLDREARSDTLLADPTYGGLREPLIKVTHLLRAMEFEPRGGREVELGGMIGKIGMEPFQQPQVFNFYYPDFTPVGAVNGAGLFAPEATLYTAPLLFGFLNGVTSLVENGLTYCKRGWGQQLKDAVLGPSFACGDRAIREHQGGKLTLEPNGTGANVTSQLSLVLTGGRLANESAYAAAYDAAAPDDKLPTLVQLIAASPEFQSTGMNKETSNPAPPPLPIVSQGRPYKAVVVLFFTGGADTYNLLIPYGQDPNTQDGECIAESSHAKYAEVRGERLAIKKEDLEDTVISAIDQPCDNYAVHPAMPFVAQAYRDGHAAFVTNVGVMSEPLSSSDYSSRSGKLVKDKSKVPPYLFSHNWQQRQAKSLHAQDYNAKGVLGRLVDSLSEQSTHFATTSYSLSGADKMVEGEGHYSTPILIDPELGPVPWEATDELTAKAVELNSAKSASVFADTYSGQLLHAINNTARIQTAMDSVNLSRPFPHQDGTATSGTAKSLSQKLYQVARLIKAKEVLGDERATFYIELGGFDTHNDGDGSQLKERFGGINDALKAFADELTLQSVEDNVTVISSSDFGRTLTSNGIGTDHGWAGNHFVMGGSVAGGQILGSYPADLTTGGNHSDDRGRVIPSTSWEAVWNAVAEWMEVDPAFISGQGVPSHLSGVLPNHRTFAPGYPQNSGALFTKADLFK
jgi:cullin-associated NEDD8-dissociated protein 1